MNLVLQQSYDSPNIVTHQIFEYTLVVKIHNYSVWNTLFKGEHFTVGDKDKPISSNAYIKTSV